VGAPFGFDLVEVLGAGSSSTVVTARPTGQDRLVILKVLHRDLSADDEITGRTRDEARLLAQLRHPNIVAVEALTSRRGCPIVVMEYIDGADLGTLLRHAPSGFPSAEVLEIVRLVARALHAAFSAPGASGRPLRVVHRDLKPSNVLLSVAGEVKVVDFNLASAEFDGQETTDGEPVLGSRGYVAPERYASREVAPSIDVYALGITLVELLTGRTVVLPRSVERHDAELARILAYVEPRDLTQDSIESLRAITRRACAHDPALRPAAGEFAASLGAIARSSRLEADLSGFAATRIGDLRRRAPPRDQDHPDWERVAFLDADTATEEADPTEPTALTRLLTRLGLLSNPRSG
jgi:serine/threonine-protein kinase